MEPYAATVPKRTLSPDQQAAIVAFYKPELGNLLVLGAFVPLVFGMLAGLALGMVAEPWGTTDMVVVGLGIGATVAVLAQVLLRWSSRRKMVRAEFIYQYGQPEPITFVGFTSDHYRKNRRPRTVINLLRGNEPLKIKTFDDRIIAAFSYPQQVAYTHPKYPDVLVPGSLFALGRAPGLAPRVVEV